MFNVSDLFLSFVNFIIGFLTDLLLSTLFPE
jgi:hypothetical protein